MLLLLLVAEQHSSILHRSQPQAAVNDAAATMLMRVSGRLARGRLACLAAQLAAAQL